MTADRLVDSQQAHTDLIGPVPPEPGWQAKAGKGFAASCFAIDWEAQQATCPQGKVSRSWKPKQDQDEHPAALIRFAPSDCRACPLRPKCVSSTRRSLCIRDHDHYVALQAARQRQHTDHFKAL